MPVSNVTTGTPITESWGDSVADSCNTLEAQMATKPAISTTVPTSSAPADVGAVGTGSTAARADHRHGREAAPAPVTFTPPTRQVFTASGTWTKPAGALYVIVEAVGGGGAGGGTAATGSGEMASSAGGGGGGFGRKLYAASVLGATESVVRGAGGTTGGAGGSGNSGAASTFSSGANLLTAGGGTGGAVGTTSSSGVITAIAGQGGTASGGDLNVSGSDGGNGVVAAGSRIPVGFGGSSFYGGSTAGPPNAVGVAGYLYGGGGSGATASANNAARAGGAGANGVVIVTTYYQ